MKLNTLFPGRANYTGPLSGYFTFVHHELLFEYSHDINERIKFILNNKPKHECATRLRHLMWLDPTWVDLSDHYSAWTSFDRTISFGYGLLALNWRVAQENLIRAREEASPRVLKYVIERMPKHKWNGRTLVFPRTRL